MPGSITLPQVVLDLEEEDRKKYDALQAPKSIVIRYGFMKMVAELPYGGDQKPGCGSKLVIRSHRGIELGEMLTTTCGNGGCGKSVTRKQMLEYIDNSGGRDYPFSTQGKVLRIATPEDMAEQGRLDGKRMPMIRFTKQVIVELDLPMKLVDIEMLLGGERIIFHYVAENWIDFRALVQRLASEYQTRIEMHQVNARDEARLVADYEKCGQHCCCKQFLKVLKPVSMRSAKVQKATLDPTKISGRCGRLMCCLRYEDETYESLRKKLPNRQSRCITDDGPGTVIDTQILTQLCLVRLDNAPAPVAIPLENLKIVKKGDPDFVPPPPPPEDRRDIVRAGDRDRRPAGERPTQGDRPQGDRPQGGDRGAQQGGRPQGERAQGDRPPRGDRPQQPRRPQPGAPLQANEIEAREGQPLQGGGDSSGAIEPLDVEDEQGGFDEGDEQGVDTGAESNDGNQPISGGQQNQAAPGAPGVPGQPGEGGRRRRRRRRRRGRGRGQGGGDQGGQGQGGQPGGGGPAPGGNGGGAPPSGA